MLYRPKRLYTFMLQTFIPVFCMTFCIVLFIVLMQFLWRYIDDLVGKGLDVAVIAELFSYAALTMVPMALPLAILLASLMTFGNLGEHFELTAMKSAGVSLIRSMKPLIALVVLIAIAAFFFQNNVLPMAQTKMWTLLFSMRQKSPEMEIPEQAFYDEIPGYNIFVEHKDPETGELYGITIYETGNGFDNSRVIMADSGRIDLAPDRSHLKARFCSGELFENVSKQSVGINAGNMPFRRESFNVKEILIPFDANFNRMDESAMRRQYVGKNISELNATIDSLQQRVDSVGNIYAEQVMRRAYFGLIYDRRPDVTEEDISEAVALDSLMNADRSVNKMRVLSNALSRARMLRQDYEYKSFVMDDDRSSIRRHDIELQKKFTLSFACLIFFFIGAPLGAIIRKGGIGLPLVVSVILFIIYYIIDNTGYKLARDGVWPVWQGMWLSSAVLLPLGVFLTIKAMRESAVFSFDAYKAWWQRIRGKQRRSLEPKEFTLEEVDPTTALQKITQFDLTMAEIKHRTNTNGLIGRLIGLVLPMPDARKAYAELNDMIDYLSNSRSAAVIAVVNQYPFRLRRREIDNIRELNASLMKKMAESIPEEPQSEAGEENKNVNY